MYSYGTERACYSIHGNVGSLFCCCMILRYSSLYGTQIIFYVLLLVQRVDCVIVTVKWIVGFFFVLQMEWKLDGDEYVYMFVYLEVQVFWQFCGCCLYQGERADRRQSVMQMATINTMFAVGLANIGVTLSTAQGINPLSTSSFVGAGKFNI